MSDDLDIEAMLEAPFRKNELENKQPVEELKLESKEAHHDDGKRNGEDDRNRNKREDRDRRDGKDREKRDDRDGRVREDKESRDKTSRDDKDRDRRDRRDRNDDRSDRNRDRDRRDRRSRSRDRERREKDRRRRSRSHDRSGRRDRTPDRNRRSHSPGLGAPQRGAGGVYYWQSDKNKITVDESLELNPEERDSRTVFVWQLSARIRPRDLDDFFSSVGKVRDVRLIMDNKTRRSKGIAYVEFYDVESVQLAIGLTGTKLLGVPIQVQQSQAEKNRAGQPISLYNAFAGSSKQGPMKLYVGNLHGNITEDMLMAIFEPFGKVDDLSIAKDPSSSAKLGYGFVTFRVGEDAKRALEQLNGFEIAGKPMKVGHVLDKDVTGGFENEELDRAGVSMGQSGRLALMAKLAEGTGLNIPQPAQAALKASQAAAAVREQLSSPSAATQCFLLTNMFEPQSASQSELDDIKEDVMVECSKHGGVIHCAVDTSTSEGRVYVKCPSIATASACVSALHGRYFSGRVITAAYVPLPAYHQIYPEAARTLTVQEQLARSGGNYTILNVNKTT